MAQNAVPRVICDRLHAGLTVGDIQEAVDFYTQKLGFVFGFLWGDPPDMAGVNLGNVSIHLFKGDPVAHEGTGGKAYFVIENVDELYEFHCNNGVHTFSPPENRP